jgi:hypothetical protein
MKKCRLKLLWRRRSRSSRSSRRSFLNAFTICDYFIYTTPPAEIEPGPFYILFSAAKDVLRDIA